MSDHYVEAEPVGPELGGVQWVYHSGYYDGPLSGLVRLQDGRELWAEMIEECNCWDEITEEHGCPAGFYRRYQVWELLPEERARLAEMHADFRAFVGTHTDYGIDEPRVVHPQERWEQFYAKWPHDPDRHAVTEGAVPVGWFFL